MSVNIKNIVKLKIIIIYMNNEAFNFVIYSFFLYIYSNTMLREDNLMTLTARQASV